MTFYIGPAQLPITWVQFEMCASAGYHMDQALPGEEAR